MTREKRRSAARRRAIGCRSIPIRTRKAGAFRESWLSVNVTSLDARKCLQIRQDARAVSQLAGRQFADDNRMNQDLLLA